MAYADKAKRNARLRENYRAKRDTLIAALGGICVRCGATEELTVEHVDGRDYEVRKLSSFQRVRRYLAEFASGVKLCLYCLPCNSSYGNYWSRFYEEAWAERMEKEGKWPPPAYVFDENDRA